MQPWHGMPNGLWIRDAVSFREWRINRSLYVLAAVLMLAPWVLVLILTAMDGPIAREVLIQQLRGLSYAPIGSFSHWDTIIAALLGLATFWNDRVRGGLESSLEGPVSRRALLRAKFRWGLAIVGVVFVVAGILMTTAALALGKPDFVLPMLASLLWCAGAAGSLLVVTLACGAVMSSVFFTALASLVWVILPLVAARVISQLMLADPLVMPHTQMLLWGTIATDVRWLSVLTPQPPGSGVGILYAVYFALGAALMGWGSLMWWDKVPMERFHDPFLFPSLWNFFYGFLALCSGFLLGEIALRTPAWFVSGALFDGLVMAFAVPLWFLWRQIGNRLRRRAVSAEYPR